MSTPTPGDGSSAQVTTTVYNNMGWVATNTLPDGGSVITVYHVTGEVATNSGRAATQSLTPTITRADSRP